MNEFDHRRRPSYGPASPTVGTRGARTRAQIVDAALRSFTTAGYYATSVDDIATAAQTSRATLYQYFESKDAIFVELMVESGTALALETRHIGPLGPDTAGYASLRRWLGESCRIYDTYAPMFIEWANVTTTRGSLRAEVAAYVDFHVERFSSAVRSTGSADVVPEVAAVVVLGIYTRFNYIRHVYRPGPSDAVLYESLACAIQRYLFPSTPDRVLSGGPRLDRPEGVSRPPVTRMGPLETLPSPGTTQRADPFEGTSKQAAGTVRQLLDAAGRVFARNGYQASNVDQIVVEAGLARGTFYRYFSDKSQLMIALSQEASTLMCPMFDQLADLGERRNPAALREWLGRFLVLQRTYGGVMRSWTEAHPVEPAILSGAAEIVGAMSHAIEATFGPARVYPLDRRAGGMLLSSLLEHVPNEAAGADYEPSDDDLVEAQARFIERVIFAD